MPDEPLSTPRLPDNNSRIPPAHRAGGVLDSSLRVRNICFTSVYRFPQVVWSKAGLLP